MEAVTLPTSTRSTTYEQINREAQAYPGLLLPEGGTALSLFSAGFLGKNDVIHFARKQMQVTCVDVDEDKLWQMAQIYPGAWEYHVADAWEFAEEASGKREWDAVSVDPFMGDAADRVWDSMWLWCSLARSFVTVTVDPKRPIWAPVGWMGYLYPRSSRASWMVLRRA